MSSFGNFPGPPNPFGDIPPFDHLLTLEVGPLPASTPAFPTLRFNPMNGLYLFINVTGYGGTDVVSLRFNGDAGANYWDRTITLPAGTTVFADTSTTATTLIRCGKPINKGRAVFAQIVNFAGKPKVVQVLNQFGSGVGATAAEATLSSAGEWVNTTDPINQIDVVTAGGLNILAGSTLVLLGWQRPVPFLP